MSFCVHFGQKTSPSRTHVILNLVENDMGGSVGAIPIAEGKRVFTHLPYITIRCVALGVEGKGETMGLRWILVFVYRVF